MNFVILTIGTRGDVQPLVALGVGLRNLGHSVRIATHENFRNLVEGHGLEFFSLAGNPDELFAKPEGIKFLEPDRNPFSSFPRWFAIWKPFLSQLMQESWDASAQADVLIGSGTAPWAPDVAIGRGIPFFHATLWPVYASAEFKPILVDPDFPGGKFVNLFLHNALGLQLWLYIRKALNRLRVEKMNLPPAGIPTLARENFTWVKGILGASNILVPRPRDWPPNTVVTGPWMLSPKSYSPPAELEQFLQAGERPICVTFSSAQCRDPLKFATEVSEAIQQAGCRAVFISGAGGFSPACLSEKIFLIDFVPHVWLFDRVSAVVSAGGAGTTADVLRAGIPHIVVPFGAEQRFWGDRIYKLGLGPRPIPAAKLKAVSLADAIRKSLQDKEMIKRCSEIGEKARNEAGVDRAIEFIFKWLSQSSAQNKQS